MTTTPPSRLSQDGDSPQGAFAAHVGLGRPARAENGALSTRSAGRASTSPLERFEDTVAFHLLRCFGITIAVMVLAGMGIIAGLWIAAADQPNPWSIVQHAFARGMAGIAQLIAGLSGRLVAFGLIVLLVFLVLAAVSARVSQPRLRVEPEPGRGERPTHPSPRT